MVMFSKLHPSFRRQYSPVAARYHSQMANEVQIDGVVTLPQSTAVGAGVCVKLP